jgi:thymidylate synthase (FAD)
MVKVLDHGFIELVETWGSDERIIEAARESTDKGFLGWGPRHADDCRYIHWLNQWVEGNAPTREEAPCTCTPMPGDEKLLRFLYENAHSTPFEFAGAVVRVQAPIFVFREWHRHRTQSYSEISARYTPLPDVNYIPSVERLMTNSKTNKQAGTIKGAEELTEESAREFRGALAFSYSRAQEIYDMALRQGVPKELARVHLPVGRYSRMRASANLRNWLQFLTLRTAPNAQWEIRQYANALQDILTEKFPRTMALWAEKK